jgi:hypothetical protein
MSFFRRFALVVVVAMISSGLWAEGLDTSVDTFFASLSDEETEYLNMSLKEEMVNNYYSANGTKTRNLLGGESWITYADLERIDVTLAAEKCFMSIRCYEKKRGELVYAVVKTMYTPIADSKIVFYNMWRERLDSDKIIDFPKFKDFFAKTSDKELGEVMNKISMMFIKVDISEEGDLLFSLNDMWLDVLNKDISSVLLQTKIKEPLRYRWTGKVFKRVES